ncbi:DNA polymerase III subunit delta [Ectothiorhodospiraceae bacterium BW-2]|nr:DNA polymerase III subunit delta [Ectothiorhodospiraceae bacterium BW-2]
MSIELQNRTLSGAIWVIGDEPLQFNETLDQLRQSARQQGYGEREVYDVEPGFNWEALFANSRMKSLFAAKTVVDVRLHHPPDAATLKQITQAITSWPADKLLLLSYAVAEGTPTKKLAWVKRLPDTLLLIQIKKIPPYKLPNWLQQRARQQRITLTTEAARRLAQLTEGNLIAAIQELQKLQLNDPERQQFDIEQLKTLQQSAHYTPFALWDAILERNPQRAVQIVQTLRAEGEAVPQLLWLIERELTCMVEASSYLSRRQSLQPLWQERNLFNSLRPATEKLLQSHSELFWQQALIRTAAIDRLGKSEESDLAWWQLEELVAKLATPQVAHAH